MSTRTAAVIVKFKRDTLATVSQASVRRMASNLGFNQEQVLHYALAHLRDELFSGRERLVLAPGGDDDDCSALTVEQLLSSNTGF